jgi:N-acetyltransferase
VRLPIPGADARSARNARASVASQSRLSVELTGSLVKLEPISRAREQELWRAAQAPEIWTWTNHIADSREDFDVWIARAMSGRRIGDAAMFATVDRYSGLAVGSTSFHHYRPDDGVVEIGSTWLSPRAWGTGVNIEAKLLMLEHAFETLSCVRVEFKTDARNTRSRSALAALPAQFEGILRKQINVAGVGVRDSAFFSVIDDEWPAVRENLNSRLARHRRRPFTRTR